MMGSKPDLNASTSNGGRVDGLHDSKVAADVRQPPPTLSDLSVIIPTMGRDVIGRCLESILNGTRWPARIIIVDQGDDPELLDWINKFRAAGIDTLRVQAPLRGAAAARNRGFEQVETLFVAATDDDCVVAPDWLERLAARLERHPSSMITGLVESMPFKEGGAAPSIFRSTKEEVHVRPLLKRDPLGSCNMGFPVSLLRVIGPMDEHPSLRLAEDAEWSYRALKSGVPIVYAPDVRVAHLEWRDPNSMSATYRGYARSQGAIYGTYVRDGDHFAALRMIFDLLRGPWILARSALSRDVELAFIGRAYVRELLPGFIAGWRRGPASKRWSTNEAVAGGDTAAHLT